MFLFWMLVIAIVSIIWAIASFVRERNKKELTQASEEISKGRVIFHASSPGPDSSSSS